MLESLSSVCFPTDVRTPPWTLVAMAVVLGGVTWNAALRPEPPARQTLARVPLTTAPETTTSTGESTTTTSLEEVTTSTAASSTTSPPSSSAPPPTATSSSSAPPTTAARLIQPAVLQWSAPVLTRNVAPYRGLGTWVDSYDFSPAFQPGGGPAPIVPEAVDRMAAEGVRTLYLQASKDDVRSPGDLLEPQIAGEFLLRAHARGMKVVAWYLPKLASIESDLRHLEAMRAFEVDGHRYDGIAVDIEWRKDVPNVAERNARLVELSRRLAEGAGGEAIGGIVLPPVVMEEVNPAYWPDFPWRGIAPFYDVWMTMGYWTFRRSDSGYKDGYRYTDENIRRLRANLGLPGALVHPIGGIGDRASDEDVAGFVKAASEHQALGVSMYDWRTSRPSSWEFLRKSPE